MESIFLNRNTLTLAPGEKIVCICDRNAEIQARAIRNYDRLVHTRSWGVHFGNLLFDTNDECVPTQAADILAYECYRAIREQVFKRGSGYAERSLLSGVLYSTSRVHIHYHRAHTLRELLRLKYAGLKMEEARTGTSPRYRSASTMKSNHCELPVP